MEVSRRRRKTDLLVALICAWAVIVALIFLWQAVSYRGIIAFAAEWQFNLFGEYFPTLSYLLLVLLFGFPVLLLVRGRWWEDDADRAPDAPYARTVAGVTRFLRAMFAIAGGCLVAAIISLLLIFLEPSSSGTVQTLRAGLNDPLPTREGAAFLDGQIVYTRTAALDQNLWVIRHGMRFAPVVAPGAPDRTIRYFVELRPEETLRRDQRVERRRGIIKQQALPGELVRLYHYAGFEFGKPYYVLYTDQASVRWPHVDVAVQLTLVAFCFALVGGWQWLVRRRLQRRAAEAEQG